MLYRGFNPFEAPSCFPDFTFHVFRSHEHDSRLLSRSRLSRPDCTLSPSGGVDEPTGDPVDSDPGNGEVVRSALAYVNRQLNHCS